MMSLFTIGPLFNKIKDFTTKLLSTIIEGFSFNTTTLYVLYLVIQILFFKFIYARIKNRLNKMEIFTVKLR